MRVAGERHGAERRRVCKYGGRKSLNMVVVESQLVQCAKTAQRRRSDLTDVVMRDADELQPGRRRAISGGSRRRAEAVAKAPDVVPVQHERSSRRRKLRNGSEIGVRTVGDRGVMTTSTPATARR